jgi:hypothetical protein
MAIWVSIFYFLILFFFIYSSDLIELVSNDDTRDDFIDDDMEPDVDKEAVVDSDTNSDSDKKAGSDAELGLTGCF